MAVGRQDESPPSPQALNPVSPGSRTSSLQNSETHLLCEPRRLAFCYCSASGPTPLELMLGHGPSPCCHPDPCSAAFGPEHPDLSPSPGRHADARRASHTWAPVSGPQPAMPGQDRAALWPARTASLLSCFLLHLLPSPSPGPGAWELLGQDHHLDHTSPSGSCLLQPPWGWASG